MRNVTLYLHKPLFHHKSLLWARIAGGSPPELVKLHLCVRDLIIFRSHNVREIKLSSARIRFTIIIFIDKYGDWVHGYAKVGFIKLYIHLHFEFIIVKPIVECTETL